MLGRGVLVGGQRHELRAGPKQPSAGRFDRPAPRKQVPVELRRDDHRPIGRDAESVSIARRSSSALRNLVNRCTPGSSNARLAHVAQDVDRDAAIAAEIGRQRREHRAAFGRAANRRRQSRVAAQYQPPPVTNS